MESLATKYRPRTFTDLRGQKSVHVILEGMVERHAVPQALVFAGPRGTGKTTSARIVAAAVNCEDEHARPCTHCVSCKSVADGTSLDVIEIDAASHGQVADIRALTEQVLYGTGGNFRIVILDEAQSISTAGFNALLKTLEQPPLNTIFILCTTEPGKIPNTIMSRCMPFDFHRIGVSHIIDRLDEIAAAEDLDIDPQLIASIAERADGGMRDAVMRLDQMTRVGVTTHAAYTELVGDIDVGPGLIANLYAGRTAAAYAIVTEQMHRTGDPRTVADSIAATLKDLLVLKSGGNLVKQGEALQRRQLLAQRLDTHAIVAAIKFCWDLKTKIPVADNQAIALDLLVALLGDALHRTTPAAAPTTGRLTLEQMKD